MDRPRPGSNGDVPAAPLRTALPGSGQVKSGQWVTGVVVCVVFPVARFVTVLTSWPAVFVAVVGVEAVVTVLVVDARLMNTIAPEPVVLPPVVLVAVEPGVVGMLNVTGVVLVVVDELVVVVVPVVLTLDPAVPDPPLTRRLVEETVPTVTIPTDTPWNAAFAAPRLFGARVWICKPPPVEVVPEDDDPEPEDVAWLGVPRVTLKAPGFGWEAPTIFPACLPVRNPCRECPCSWTCSGWACAAWTAPATPELGTTRPSSEATSG